MNTLTLSSGSGSLSPGGYAIIAENPATFANEFSSYGGLVFDSSFSLNNSGENLSLKDQNSVEYSSFVYDPTLGGAGNGKTLQRSGSNWQEGDPTPGSALSISSPDTNTSDTTTNTENISPTDTSGGGTTSSWPIEPRVFVDAGSDRVVVVGATIRFNGKAYGLKKEPLENARFHWNFGDGVIHEGATVDHVFRYPGEYIVVLDVSSGYFSGTDRLRVIAEPSPLSITKISLGGAYVTSIHNASGRDIDLSGWIISIPTKQWTIPQNTFIAGGKDLRFGGEITGLILTEGMKLLLSYPNGMRATEEGQKVAPPTPIKNQTGITTVSKQNSSATNNVLSRSVAETQVAYPSAASSENSGLIWFLGVIGLAVLSIAGLFYARRLSRDGESETDVLAEEFEIEER